MIDFEQKQAKPITDWVNEPTVEVLKRDLELACFCSKSIIINYL